MPVPSFTSESFAHDDKLFAGDKPRVTGSVTVLSGNTVAKYGLMGKVLFGTATAAAKTGGNTGDGTITLDATTPILANAQAGVYAVRCIAAVTNGGVFRVTDPKGNVLGDCTITPGAGGTGAFANQIKFVLTDNTTDFIVGDGFDVTIPAGSLKYILSLAAAVDGSQYPTAIALEAIDGTSADAVGPALFEGEVNEDVLVLGTGHTLASVRDALRDLGIFLKTVVAQT